MCSAPAFCIFNVDKSDFSDDSSSSSSFSRQQLFITVISKHQSSTKTYH